MVTLNPNTVIEDSLVMAFGLRSYIEQTLAMMRKTDFKNLSKSDVLSIASKLGELRPDVAKEVIVQFLEFAKLLAKRIQNSYS